MVEYECQGGVIDLPGLKHNTFFFIVFFLLLLHFFLNMHIKAFVYFYIFGLHDYDKNDINSPIVQQ